MISLVENILSHNYRVNMPKTKWMGWFFAGLLCLNTGYGEEIGYEGVDSVAYYDNADECCYEERMWWDKPVWATCCCEEVWGEWIPDAPPLFRPFMADPRQIAFGTGWRFDDQVLVKNVIPVQYGDSFAFYRWHNVWPWCGDLQVEIEGALWAVFDPLHESSPLINADYYGGLTVTYAIDCWQFRLRGFHISSHIGDEFLLTHPNFCRRNPSAEYLDFFVSNDFTEDIRFYSGIGYIVAVDDSFNYKRWYGAVGFELRIHELGFVNECQCLYGTPIFGLYARWSREFKHHIDTTWVLGYEFGKFSGIERRLRFFLEYHDGYSVDGQFSKLATNYFAIRVTYGF